MITLQKKPADHLTDAYHAFISELSHTLANSKNKPYSLQKILTQVKSKIQKQGSICKEEIDLLCHAIKNDISDIAEEMMQYNTEFYACALLDFEEIEYNAMSNFISCAQQTRHLLNNIKHQSTTP